MTVDVTGPGLDVLRASLPCSLILIGCMGWGAYTYVSSFKDAKNRDGIALRCAMTALRIARPRGSHAAALSLRGIRTSPLHAALHVCLAVHGDCRG